MKSTVIFEEGQHRWIVIGRDPEKSSHVIDTNEYVIVSKGEGMLLDPGGIEIFPRVLAELSSAGLIKVEGKMVRILDAEGLRNYRV